MNRSSAIAIAARGVIMINTDMYHSRIDDVEKLDLAQILERMREAHNVEKLHSA
jgi:hypothetical protein